MAKLRHIAIIVPDPETSAQFFEKAFERFHRFIYMGIAVNYHEAFSLVS